MTDAEAEHRYRLMWEMAHAASQERAEVAEAATVDFRATIDHLRDQLSRKDAEIEHLKLEMEGVENAKEEIGRLLGLTEEFRWKRISAAIHEQKRLIRELVTMTGQALADTERNPLETGFNHSSETARELARGQLLVRNGLFDALAKAKAAGYEP